MKDLDKYLKNINIPHLENKTHYELLEKKLKMRIKNIDDNEIKNIKNLFNPVLKYAYVSFIIIFFITLIFYPKQLKFFVYNKKGNVYLKANDKKNYLNIKKINKFNKSNLIKTDIASSISFKLGNNYNINIAQSSELKLLQFQKIGNSETCKIYMINGQAEYSVKLPTKNSTFQVNTEFSNFYVKGTKFIVDIKKDESARLIVKEGTVMVGNYLKRIKNIKKIKKLDNDIFIKLSDLINSRLMVNQDNFITIKKDDIDLLNKMLYENVYAKLINNKIINSIEKKEILENINKIKMQKDSLLYKKDFEEKNNYSDIEQGKDTYKVIKLPCKINTFFYEKNTAITGYENLLFIASDNNKEIYCINTDNGTIKWRFKDKNLVTIKSPVISYKNEIVFGSPYHLFILNNNGSIKLKKEIKNGPDYWINPVKAENLLFIPTSQTIYKYDGSNIKTLENFHDLNGPLYISYKNNRIYTNDLNGKKIKIYDLSKNKIIWQSEELWQRAFMNPEITDDYIFIIDIGGIIYSYNIKSLSTPPKKINIKSGVMSNIIFRNNILYFVANDGYLYKINVDSFNQYQKVVRVDNDKNIDKYLTKKILFTDNKLYYCSDNGNLFYYNCDKEEYKLINVCKNLLIGSPVLLNNNIYIVDDKSNIYAIVKD